MFEKIRERWKTASAEKAEVRRVSKRIPRYCPISGHEIQRSIHFADVPQGRRTIDPYTGKTITIFYDQITGVPINPKRQLCVKLTPRCSNHVHVYDNKGQFEVWSGRPGSRMAVRLWTNAESIKVKGQRDGSSVSSVREADR